MRAQWVAAGLEALRKGGAAEVRVERLAAQLGITKGSFYWHFRDRGELLDALLEHWAREMTDAEFERIEAMRATLAERLLALAQDVLQKGMGRYDPAIRGWARTDRKVAAAVARVDRRRVFSLMSFFEESGFSAADARTRARLFYTFLLGEPQVRSPARESGELERMVAILAYED
ncbi:MAG: TetR/AcrR family transcriptional regulator [Betaproteobacteria bacterium]|nr:MAG: TetR/AcrR family transcriptional regulator [Betaproteobacteria bacterium]